MNGRGLNGQNGNGQSSQAGAQVELLDICWNLVKLANISRKHELPTLALYYQESAEKRLLSVPHGYNEQLKFERYKLIFENLKLELKYNTEDPQQLEKRIEDAIRIAAAHTGLELWQRASIRRVIADHYMDQGKIGEAQKLLVASLSEMNKRDPKIWLSYARLNEIVFDARGAECVNSLLNALKGLLFATTLSLHKSRLIIPRIFRLLRANVHRCSGRV